MVEQRRGPGRWLYVLALFIFLGGVVAAGILVFVSVRHFTNLTHSFTRVVAPGTSTVELNQTGTYTIFYEYHSQVDGRTFSTTETPPNLQVTVKSAATGNLVNVHSSSNSTYSLGSHSGVSILSFSIDSPGSYEISTQYTGGTSGPDFVLAIGHGFAKDIVGGVASILGSAGIFCGTTVLAIILTIVVFIMRQRSGARRDSSRSTLPPA